MREADRCTRDLIGPDKLWSQPPELLGFSVEFFVDFQCAPVLADQAFWRDPFAADDFRFHIRDQPLRLHAARPKWAAGNFKMPRRRMRKADPVFGARFKTTPCQPR